MLPILACTTNAAFSFSNPGISITAGPGLGSGPTVFNTYSHDLTTLGSGAAASAAANAYSAPSYGYGAGWVPPVGPACPPIPGCDNGLPYGIGSWLPSVFSAYPASADQAVNQEWGNQALEDNTFATSFYTAGTSPFGGLCNACISGNAPQEFTLQFF
ncbi:MAG TPA: hypothetical protein VMC84_07985 [Methanocella sp.]|uniref:hypothetical protein n=1 Tax=Methanocella sp. TaxID=2052833 RepID=UPI002CCD24C0|nr:hypothetical protein [Methanocella sp.]HTY91099.1 hypothetical protein [Methanocella sp.]